MFSDIKERIKITNKPNISVQYHIPYQEWSGCSTYYYTFFYGNVNKCISEEDKKKIKKFLLNKGIIIDSDKAWDIIADFITSLGYIVSKVKYISF